MSIDKSLLTELTRESTSTNSFIDHIFSLDLFESNVERIVLRVRSGHDCQLLSGGCAKLLATEQKSLTVVGGVSVEHSEIFGLSSDIRYVAVYRSGNLELTQRNDLNDASSTESDTYEELLVNPTLLKLVSQRGQIDCGGAEFVMVGYGNFLQLVIALSDGHVSVAFEHGKNPLEYVEAIRKVCDSS